MTMINSKRLVTIFISLLLVICVFFPGDTLNLNVVFWGGACVFGLNAFVSSIKKGKYSYIIIMGTLYPFLLMIWSSIITGKISAAISEAYCPVYILLFVLIGYYEIDYEKIVMIMLKILAILTVSIFLLDFLGMIDVNSGFINSFVYKYDMGIMGKSPMYANYYKIFFKASPLLVLLFPYCMKRKQFFMVGIVFFALVISGTRANMLVGAMLLLIGIISIWQKNKKSQIIIIGVILLLFLMIFPQILIMLEDIMNATGSVNSDTVRIGQIRSFFDVLSNPQNLILGQGFGSEFWDAGRMMYSFSSEISYFDLLRKIGLIWFIPFAYFILKPFKFQIDIYIKLTYCGYLLIALTNPLLFSTTAFVMYIYLYSKQYQMSNKFYKNKFVNAEKMKNIRNGDLKNSIKNRVV